MRTRMHYDAEDRCAEQPEREDEERDEPAEEKSDE